MKRIRLGIVIPLIVIAVLSSAFIVRQRREARLRAALAAYKSQAQGQLVRNFGQWVPVDWPEGTTLEDAIALIRSRSIWFRPYWSFPNGAPILVDPEALRRTGKTMKSTVKRLPPNPDQNLTLRQRLRSVLEPMGLACEVKDGAITITTPDAIENPDLEEPAAEGIAP